MKLNFRNHFLALLTTLFVSAMPLQAAYALADDGKTKEACEISYNDVLTQEALDKVKSQNGTVTELEGVRAQAFQSRLEDLIGQKAPFTSNKIVLVNPDAEEGNLINVAFFVDNCLKAILHLPQPVVETLLSPLEKKPGERVD